MKILHLVHNFPPEFLGGTEDAEKTSEDLLLSKVRQTPAQLTALAVQHEGDPDGGAEWRRSIVPLDADVAIFHTDLRRYTTETALDDIDEATGLVHLSTGTIGGSERQYISDQRFFTVLETLAEALEELPGSLEDSDGDGFTDIAEAAAGTDPFDSEDHP